MKIYTVIQLTEYHEEVTNLMWNKSFTSFEGAKTAIEKETTEMFEIDLKDAKENGYEEPDKPERIKWENPYEGEWVGYREYDETWFGIQETELE